MALNRIGGEFIKENRQSLQVERLPTENSGYTKGIEQVPIQRV